ALRARAGLVLAGLGDRLAVGVHAVLQPIAVVVQPVGAGGDRGLGAGVRLAGAPALGRAVPGLRAGACHECARAGEVVAPRVHAVLQPIAVIVGAVAAGRFVRLVPVVRLARAPTLRRAVELLLPAAGHQRAAAQQHLTRVFVAVARPVAVVVDAVGAAG